jgi:hypothetical protein
MRPFEVEGGTRRLFGSTLSGRYATPVCRRANTNRNRSLRDEVVLSIRPEQIMRLCLSNLISAQSNPQGSIAPNSAMNPLCGRTKAAAASSHIDHLRNVPKNELRIPRFTNFVPRSGPWNEIFFEYAALAFSIFVNGW